VLWYKAWLETRWRFLIGLALLLCSSGAMVLIYPRLTELISLVPPNGGGQFTSEIREAMEIQHTYRGYIWYQWFRQNLPQWGTVFAVLLGAAGPLSAPAGALFTLSLPVSRARLLGVRTATALAEVFALSFGSSLLIPLLSAAIGQHYAIADAVIHSACFFVAVSAFFMVAVFFSTIFDDPWRPPLLALAVAVVLSLLNRAFRRPAYSGFGVMSAESYFRSGHLPWLGLLAIAVVSAALYGVAVAMLRRRDF
jgi:hypothetical protein